MNTRAHDAWSHVLPTVPFLVLAFLAWGVGSARAFAAWAPLALFVPSAALVNRAWLLGPDAPPGTLAGGLLPAIVAAAGLALNGSWLLAAFFALWAVRAGALVGARRAATATTMPSFRSIRAFGRETWGWAAVFVVVWAGTWLRGG
ncbi:MAG: hypothetical protein ABI780_08070 [Ardenticatenales bacterium]